jgi:hypothetical protein
LLEKYPDKDADTLRQIVMADVSKMSDLEVLVKHQKIDMPSLAESDIEVVLKDKYGIDPDTKPEEWSSIARTKLAIDAQSARANIKSLTNGIEMPKTVSKEQRDLEASQVLQNRVKNTSPLKEEFTKFDTFEKGGFKYDVPAEAKAKLPAMFDAMFVEAGMEATPENLQTAKDMRDGQFLLDNFEKIIEVAVKQGQTEIQKKLDEALNNTTPPNTATATDNGKPTNQLPGPGLDKLLENWR